MEGGSLSIERSSLTAFCKMRDLQISWCQRTNGIPLLECEFLFAFSFSPSSDGFHPLPSFSTHPKSSKTLLSCFALRLNRSPNDVEFKKLLFVSCDTAGCGVTTYAAADSSTVCLLFLQCR